MNMKEINEPDKPKYSKEEIKAIRITCAVTIVVVAFLFSLIIWVASHTDPIVP